MTSSGSDGSPYLQCDHFWAPSSADREIRACTPSFREDSWRKILQWDKCPKGTVNITPDIGHPADLARVLLSIGQVVQGTLQSVSLQGGCCCSWIAAWADFVLGL